MDASPAPSPPSPSSPVPRPPTRTLIIIDCDPEDLGREATPIGPPVEPALRRPSPYAMMHARVPTRASMAAAVADGNRAADPPTRRFEPPLLPLRFDPLLPIDPRRLAEINAGAPSDSRETATVVHSSQSRGVELSRFRRAGCGSNRWLRHRQPSRQHRPHRRRPQDLRRWLIPLQGASRSFPPSPEVSSPIPMA
jgi:hypothetical protein